MEERDLELAEKLAAQERESGMEAVRKRLQPEYHEDFDGESCVECGNPVGVQRLAYGRIRCTECQTVREKKKAMGIPVEPDQHAPRGWEPPRMAEMIALIAANGGVAPSEDDGVPKAPQVSNSVKRTRTKALSKGAQVGEGDKKMTANAAAKAPAKKVAIKKAVTREQSSPAKK